MSSVCSLAHRSRQALQLSAVKARLGLATSHIFLGPGEVARGGLSMPCAGGDAVHEPPYRTTIVRQCTVTRHGTRGTRTCPVWSALVALVATGEPLASSWETDQSSRTSPYAPLAIFIIVACEASAGGFQASSAWGCSWTATHCAGRGSCPTGLCPGGINSCTMCELSFRIPVAIKGLLLPQLFRRRRNIRRYLDRGAARQKEAPRLARSCAYAAASFRFGIFGVCVFRDLVRSH